MSISTSPNLAAARLRNLQQILAVRRAVRVDELSDELGVSPATIRRDLADLDAQGLARRVHGGAVSVSSAGRLEEPLFDDKAAHAAAEKQRIAEAARDFVGADDSLFLDGGSTVLRLARLLTDLTDVTVLTNSLHVAKRFAAAGPRLIMTGGEFRRLSQTFVGSMTHPLIDKLHVDKAFMGTIGLTAEAGMTTTDPREAHTKERVMTHASQVILLADSSKIGKVSFARFGDLDRVDVLITNRGAPEGELKELRNRGIKVIEA